MATGTDNTLPTINGQELLNYTLTGVVAGAQPGTQYLVELPGQPEAVFGVVSRAGVPGPVLPVRELVAEIHTIGLDSEDTDDLPVGDVNRRALGRASAPIFWQKMALLSTYPGGVQTWCSWTANGSLKVDNFAGSMTAALRIASFAAGLNAITLTWSLEQSSDDGVIDPWVPIARLAVESYKIADNPEELNYKTGRVPFVRTTYYRVTVSRVAGAPLMNLLGRTPVLTFTLFPTEFF